MLCAALSRRLGSGRFIVVVTETLPEAERWLAEADGHFRRQDAFGTAFNLEALRVGIAFFTGEPARARETLASVLAMLGGNEPLPTQAGYLARAEGWAARALSDAAGVQSFQTASAALCSRSIV